MTPDSSDTPDLDAALIDALFQCRLDRVASTAGAIAERLPATLRLDEVAALAHLERLERDDRVTRNRRDGALVFDYVPRMPEISGSLREEFIEILARNGASREQVVGLADELIALAQSAGLRMREKRCQRATEIG